MESRKTGWKNYYEVLGVEPDSDSAAIKKAYRALVQRYHPDRLHDRQEITNASERMIEINEAFAVLADSKRRAEFDRETTALKTPPKPPEPAEEDWDIPIATPKEAPPAAKRNTAVERSVAQEFLDKLKAQLLSEMAGAKFKEEGDPGWKWSLVGKTWGAGYWIGVRQVSLLNPNSAKEMLGQLQAVAAKRRSGWKNSLFIAVFAFDSLQEGEVVLKLCRGFANREENNTPRNRINVVVLDLNQRRLVLCGKKTSDMHHGAILRALGV
jgi:hypothetical protein